MKENLSYFCVLITSLFLLACEKHNETLVLYTSQPSKDISSLLKAFQKKYPDINVEVFRSGTVEVLDKIALEIKSGDLRPDIVMISDTVAMENLYQKNILKPLDMDLSNFPSAFYNEDKTYCGTKKISIGIAYRQGVSPAPESFADLTKSEFKGKVVMASPFYSGSMALMLGVLLENSNLGWSFYKKLKENDVALVNGNGDVIEALVKGEKLIGIVVDFMALNAKSRGSPVEFVYPKEGVITLTEPIALVKKKNVTKEHLENAKKLVQFILSKEGQEFAKKQGYKSIRDSDYVDSKMISINIEKLLTSMEENKKKFEELFGR